jgi:hypothetical protein
MNRRSFLTVLGIAPVVAAAVAHAPDVPMPEAKPVELPPDPPPFGTDGSGGAGSAATITAGYGGAPYRSAR